MFNRPGDSLRAVAIIVFVIYIIIAIVAIIGSCVAGAQISYGAGGMVATLGIVAGIGMLVMGYLIALFCSAFGTVVRDTQEIRALLERGASGPQASAPTGGAGSAPQPQFCHNCGTRMEPGARFCPNCGQEN